MFFTVVTAMDQIRWILQYNLPNIGWSMRKPKLPIWYSKASGNKFHRTSAESMSPPQGFGLWENVSNSIVPATRTFPSLRQKPARWSSMEGQLTQADNRGRWRVTGWVGGPTVVGRTMGPTGPLTLLSSNFKIRTCISCIDDVTIQSVRLSNV